MNEIHIVTRYLVYSKLVICNSIEYILYNVYSMVIGIR